ncbi:MAG: hypothetical protein AAF772_18970, partial [Acidobacteriota bacterium]
MLRDALRPHLPAAFLLLTAVGVGAGAAPATGTLFGGVDARAAALGHLLVLGLAAFGPRPAAAQDNHRRGAIGWLAAALVAATALALTASSVPRA